VDRAGPRFGAGGATGKLMMSTGALRPGWAAGFGATLDATDADSAGACAAGCEAALGGGAGCAATGGACFATAAAGGALSVGVVLDKYQAAPDIPSAAIENK